MPSPPRSSRPAGRWSRCWDSIPSTRGTEMDRAADVLLSDGSTVHMRQIGPADADAIVALHSRFSDRTRYLRYFAPYPRIPARDLARFVNVDHRDREAPVVSSGGQPVAVGRRELTAEARSIARLLAPRTVAVYGGGRFGAALRRNLSTFAGTVHLDGDLAVVALPADAVLGAVDDAAAQGATAVVVVSAGFAEAGPEGARLQDELLRRCR